MPDERKLLYSVTKSDCIRQTFRSGGPGGQHQNKTETGVRWVHKASGAVEEARDSRSQKDNERAAWVRMVATPKFQTWLKRTTARILTGKTAEQRVEEDMRPEKIRVEVRRNGRWEIHGLDTADDDTTA